MYERDVPHIIFATWNANSLKLKISKLLRMQIEPYNSKAARSDMLIVQFFDIMAHLSQLNLCCVLKVKSQKVTRSSSHLFLA